MGFFSWLFGLFGKGAKAPVEVKLDSAMAFFEGSVSGQKAALLGQSAKFLAEIRHFLREADASLQRLGSADSSGESARLHKIVGTAKDNAFLQMSSLVGKLQPPNSSDLGVIRSYCLESMASLQQAGSFGKNVAYAGISFKDEMKAVGHCITQVGGRLVSLQQLFSENAPVFLQPALEAKLRKFSELREAGAAVEGAVSALKSGLLSVGNEKETVVEGLRLLREREFGPVGQLNEQRSSLLREKQEAKTALLDLFAQIERPLHRIGKAAKAGKSALTSEEDSFLQQLLVNPFLALKRDPKAETLKAILLKTREAVDSGVIELKEKEREKQLAVLQELLSFDFFSGSFWRFNKIDVQLLALEKQLNEMPAIKRELQLSSSLKQLQAKEAQLNGEIAAKCKQLSQGSGGMQGLLGEMQQILRDVSKRDVVLLP